MSVYFEHSGDVLEARSEPSTLVELLRWRGLNQADRRAYTFLVDGETEEVHITYGELDRQARAIAALLQDLKAEGERALLLYPPGLEYIAAFFGCLYAGVIAVPVYPPDPARLDRTLPRLQAIAKDAQVNLVMTTQPILSMTEMMHEQIPDLRSLHWIATDSVEENIEDNWKEFAVSEDSLAFLQYTSGATRSPKGVMLTHGNLLHNLALIHRCYEHTSNSQGVIWLPPYHDMGLIGGILQPLYAGFPVALMSPIDILQRPVRWMQAITRYRGTTSGGPNFSYDLCVRKIAPEQKKTLDLSTWDVAFCGAEPIHQETLDRFVEAFEPCGFRREAFYPCYGLAEGTLIVSGGRKAVPPIVKNVQKQALQKDQIVEASPGEESVQQLVGCGHSLQDQQIVIVDPETLTRCSPDQVGEIWVSGPSVAPGYWNRPEETQETFQVYITESNEGPFMRTGDLGFIKNGELFVTGRLKDMIIVSGINYYPQDIEQTVESAHPSVRPGCCAAFSVSVDGEEKVVVVAEIAYFDESQTKYELHLDLNTVMGDIRQRVAEQNDLTIDEIILIKKGGIPKTSSGKIIRFACRANYIAGKLEAFSCKLNSEDTSRSKEGQASKERVVFQGMRVTRTEIQAWLVSNLAKELKVKDDDIDIHTPFTRYGLKSIVAVNLSGELEDWLERRLPATVFWDYPTIEALAQYLTGESVEHSRKAPISTFEKTNEYKTFVEEISRFDGVNPYFVAHDSIVKDTSYVAGKELINFAGYNYLGLSGHPETVKAAEEALVRFGTSCSGSRVVTGEKSLYLELEMELARWKNVDDALVMVSGHATNVSFIGNFCNERDFIIYDEFAHNSIEQGSRLSRAKIEIFPHNNYNALEEILKRARNGYEKILVVVEGVYSMDGDIAPIPEFVKLKKEYGVFLMVDEAHSTCVLGETGEGVDEYFELAPEDIDIRMGTLSKGIGACGGYLAGKRNMIKYLRYNLPGFVFSVGISPPVAAAALAAIRLIQKDHSMVARLHTNIDTFMREALRRNFNTCLAGKTAIIPILIGEDQAAFSLSVHLREQGVFVVPAVYPAVPKGQARLRFCVTSDHKLEQIVYALDTLQEVAKQEGIDLPTNFRRGAKKVSRISTPKQAQSITK